MKTPETVAWGCACSEPISNDDAGGPLECFECKQITEPLIRRADVIAWLRKRTHTASPDGKYCRALVDAADVLEEERCTKLK